MDAALLSRIDLLQLAIHSGADTQGIRRMLIRYLESAEDCLSQMERAGASRNILSWSHALQEMKEASSAITARRLAGLCTEAESIRAFPPRANGSAALPYAEGTRDPARRDPASGG